MELVEQDSFVPWRGFDEVYQDLKGSLVQKSVDTSLHFVYFKAIVESRLILVDLGPVIDVSDQKVCPNLHSFHFEQATDLCIFEMKDSLYVRKVGIYHVGVLKGKFDALLENILVHFLV